MSGDRDYSSIYVKDRARMLSYFHEFAVRCPVRHKTFLYAKKEYGLRGGNPDAVEISQRLGEQMERDIKILINENLSFLQKFDRVKIYYDNGQKAVSKSLRNAFDECLSHGSVEFKTNVTYSEYRLCQIADMFCGFAFLDFKFANGLQNKTDKLFADNYKNLRTRFLKKINKLDIDKCGLE